MEETKRMQGEWAGETKGWMCLGWLGRPRKDSRAKPSGSLGPPVAQGIQELKTQVFVAATSGNQITSGTVELPHTHPEEC